MFKLDLNKCSQFNKDNIDAINIDGNMDNKNIDKKISHPVGLCSVRSEDELVLVVPANRTLC